MENERWNTLHPDEEPRTTWVEQSLASRPSGPVIAATDYMRSFADQIRPWVDAPYRVLGTDGYGRSDYRKTLRSFFEVDRHHVVLAALTELAKTGADRPVRAQAGDRDLRHRPRAARAVEGLREARYGQQVLVPDIGDFDDVPVIEVLVAVGDEVAAEDPLVVLESDKATMEVPSPSAGKVAAIKVAVGDKVKEGSLIVELEVSGGGNGAEPAPAGCRRRVRAGGRVQGRRGGRGAAAGRRARASGLAAGGCERRARVRVSGRAPSRARAGRRSERRSPDPVARAGSPKRICRSRKTPRPLRLPRLRRPLRSPASTSPRGRRSTSSATARSSASRSRGSRRSAARTWPATG